MHPQLARLLGLLIAAGSQRMRGPTPHVQLITTRATCTLSASRAFEYVNFVANASRHADRQGWVPDWRLSAPDKLRSCADLTRLPAHHSDCVKPTLFMFHPSSLDAWKARREQGPHPLSMHSVNMDRARHAA